jgi:hypothetical protein
VSSRKRSNKLAVDKQRLEQVLFVRMTKSDRRLVNAAAKRKGLSASAYARMVILDRIHLDQENK